MTDFQATLQGIFLIKQNLKAIQNLKKEAFKVFRGSFPLSKMQGALNDSWSRLYNWNENSNYGYLKLQNWADIEAAFSQVATASINRFEFEDALKESRNYVDEYIKELNKALDEYHSTLSDYYDGFFDKNAGDLNFIFKDDKVKDLIMKFKQSETC